ncbi:MAG: glycosyltransferase family 4 protein [Chitinophagaceae bacterium]
MVRPRILLTVTNDLSFDQRMMRIATSLSDAGYDVCLIGRKRPSSKPLPDKPYEQKRLFCFFEFGKLFYIEYNVRLFLFLLFANTDVYCAIDLDTILPNYFASVLRRKKRVYDAHELFCEMDEITSRPAIYKAWKAIEGFAVPKFPKGYTIGDAYAGEFKRMYGVNYTIVRNATILKPIQAVKPTERFLLYQGAVNEGRCFETLIPAMKQVDCPLVICGEGNFFEQAKALVKQHQLEHRIRFEGYVPPDRLREYTEQAYAGITLFTGQGKSNYFSMANRFFDYMHAGIPQLTVDYPEYRNVNEQFEISVLIHDTDADTIANALNTLLHDAEWHARLKQNCLKAREVYCWQEEEKKLIHFYQELFATA